MACANENSDPDVSSVVSITDPNDPEYIPFEDDIYDDDVEQIPDTEVNYYGYSSDWKDSTFECTKFYNGDALLKSEEHCHEYIPKEDDYARFDILSIGDTVDTYETFDSLMCEVGGNSAYDKFIFKKDAKGRVVEVEHYMAWFETYTVDENGEEVFELDYTPDYFLGHLTIINHEENWIQLKSIAEDGDIMYDVKNHFKNDRLIRQEGNVYGDNRKAFYTYLD